MVGYLNQPDHVAIKRHLDYMRRHNKDGECTCTAHGLEVIPDLYEVVRRSQFLAQVLPVLAALLARDAMFRTDEEGGVSSLMWHLVEHADWHLAKSVLTDARHLQWV